MCCTLPATKTNPKSSGLVCDLYTVPPPSSSRRSRRRRTLYCMHACDACSARFTIGTSIERELRTLFLCMLGVINDEVSQRSIWFFTSLSPLGISTTHVSWDSFFFLRCVVFFFFFFVVFFFFFCWFFFFFFFFFPFFFGFFFFFFFFFCGW